MTKQTLQCAYVALNRRKKEHEKISAELEELIIAATNIDDSLHLKKLRLENINMHIDVVNAMIEIANELNSMGV